jgi:hypothetical protein
LYEAERCLTQRISPRREEQSGGSGHRTEFHIVFLPRKSLLCEMRLKEKGVFGSFTFIDDLPIFWYPLDSDVVSMEDRFVSFKVCTRVLLSTCMFHISLVAYFETTT